MAAAKRFSYVVGRPNPGSWSVDSTAGRVTLSTEHVIVEASLDPWQVLFRAPDGRLLTHQVHDDANFAGHRFGPRPGLEVESLPHDPARRVRGVVETLLLDPDDHFYGSGERFGRLDLVGRTVTRRFPFGPSRLRVYRFPGWMRRRSSEANPGGRSTSGAPSSEPERVGSRFASG